MLFYCDIRHAKGRCFFKWWPYKRKPALKNLWNAKKKQLIWRIYYDDTFYGKWSFFCCVNSTQDLAVKSVLFKAKAVAPTLSNTIKNCKNRIFRTEGYYCLETNLVIFMDQYTLHILKAKSFQTSLLNFYWIGLCLRVGKFMFWFIQCLIIGSVLHAHVFRKAN